MQLRRFSPFAARLLGATALATILAIAPISVTIQGPSDGIAWAKGGGGGGGGGGNGGGNGGGGDRGGGDRGGGDRGGDRGGGDKGGGDRADRGNSGKDGGRDNGRGNDFGRGGLDPGIASLGRESGRGHGDGRGHDNGRGRDMGGRSGASNFGLDTASRAKDFDHGRGSASAFGRDIASRAQDLGKRDDDRRDGRDIGRNLADRRDGDRRDGRDVSRSAGDRRDSDRRDRDFARSDDRRDGRTGKNSLGNLNAAHASATARANAAPNSMVGRIAAYETQMRAALAIEDRAARNAAIVAAREQLAQAANKPLTERNIARVDDLLGIQGAPARLGAERRDRDRRDFDRRDSDRRDQARRDFDWRDFDRRELARNLDDRRDGRNTLGNLNAAHASATARANAAPNSMVGRIAAYETQMRAALAIEDRAARNAAIVAAREQLAQAANKPLTERNIARVDNLLGIQGAPARLGAERRDLDRRDFDRRDLSRVGDRRDRDFIRDLFDDRRDGRRDFSDLSRRDREFVRDLFDDHRHGRDGLAFGGFSRGVGFGNVPVDPARIEARAAALDARGDRRAAEIRATADRIAAGIISRADARAAEIRARGATAEDPAKFEARAAAVQARGNAIAAELITRADRRADALNSRVEARVEDIRAIAAYDRAMVAALEIDDPAARTAAISAARADLRAAFDQPLSARTIDRLDDRLGLENTPTATSQTASR